MIRQARSAVMVCTSLVFLAGSIVLAFLSEHPRVGYPTNYHLGSTALWVQFAGLLLLTAGSYGLAWDASPRSAASYGVGFVLIAVITPLFFGGYTAVVNVHRWTAVLFFPLSFLLVAGALLGVVGGVKLVLPRQY